MTTPAQAPLSASGLMEIIERLEKAEGEPDWELTRDIGLSLDGWEYLSPEHEVSARFPEYRWLRAFDDIFADRPGTIAPDDCWYLENVDAALSLCARVLPGYTWGLHCHTGAFRAHVTKQSPLRPMPCIADAPTPPLALCLAICKAKAAILPAPADAAARDDGGVGNG